MTYNTAAILKDAHGRTARQWQRQGYKSYAAAFRVYLAQAWYTAQRNARLADHSRHRVISAREWAELRTDGPINGWRM